MGYHDLEVLVIKEMGKREKKKNQEREQNN